jgi:hypothetical protein
MADAVVRAGLGLKRVGAAELWEFFLESLAN